MKSTYMSFKQRYRQFFLVRGVLHVHVRMHVMVDGGPVT